MVPDEVLEDEIFLDMRYHHDIKLLTHVQNFSSIVYLILCQRALSLMGILGAFCWFLTRYLDDRVILDIRDHYGI